jgi:uncharacterized LabA/DUF88 family protein
MQIGNQMEDKKFALLIDVDNISYRYIKLIINELSSYGTVTIKRAYGDWTDPKKTKWKDILLSNSVNPVQQYSYTFGKNASDSAMIIDAMDILYSGHVNGFCLASSDSDFTRLAMRLRESGMTVIGMGESKTPEPFCASCERFVYLDLLSEMEQGDENGLEENGFKAKINGSKVAETLTPITTIEDAIIRIIAENGNNGCNMDIGELGSRLTKMYTAFDVRNYGYSKFSKFLETLSTIHLKFTENTVVAYLAESQLTMEDIEKEVIKIILSSGKHKINTGELKQKLTKNHPDFNVRNFGYSQFSKMLQEMKELKVTNMGKEVSINS